MHLLKEKISLVVITYNEEHQIGRCLESVIGIADEIIIVDSGSTDKTIQIAQSFGAKVLHRAWTGYADQKNYGNEQTTNQYILSLDADESLDIKLHHNIQQAFQQQPTAAYELNFLTAWEQKWIRFGGWVPDRHVRLFDKTKIKWVHEGVHEFLDMGDIKPTRLKGHVLHHTATSRLKYEQKMIKYASEFAHNKKALNQKSAIWKKYFSTAARFIKDYILKGGFLEGKAGWQIAKAEAKYTYYKYKWSE